jgi:hypothetical protein
MIIHKYLCNVKRLYHRNSPILSAQLIKKPLIAHFPAFLIQFPDIFGDIIGDKLAYSLPRILRGHLTGVFREVSGSISLQKSPVGSIDRAGTMKD